MWADVYSKEVGLSEKQVKDIRIWNKYPVISMMKCIYQYIYVYKLELVHKYIHNFNHNINIYI